MQYRLPIFAAFVSTLTLLFSACSSRPSAPDERDFAPPAWTHQSSRTIEGGYIIYVASAEDRSLDRANLKAESQAVQDLVNECSFAPKGTRIEARYQRMDGGLHQSFAKVAVEFQLCEEAKQAVEPARIRALASAPFTEELKRYQDVLAQESKLSDSNDSARGNPMLADTHAPSDPSSTSRIRWVVIRDEPQFWMIRQEVAVQKQVIILSPSTAYTPNSLQTRQLTTQLSGASQEIQKYETANPQVKSGSWSGFQRTRKVTGPSSYVSSNRSLTDRPNRLLGGKRRGKRRHRL